MLYLTILRDEKVAGESEGGGRGMAVGLGFGQNLEGRVSSLIQVSSQNPEPQSPRRLTSQASLTATYLSPTLSILASISI